MSTDALALTLPAEYHQVDIDLAYPGTIPWFDDCPACVIRRQVSVDRDPHAESWLPDIAGHFWGKHKIELIQHRASQRMSELVPIHGPFERVEYAIRYRVIAEDSPIRGQVTYDDRLSQADAELVKTMYTGRPDMFDHVAVVKRTITVTEWEEL